MSIHKSQLFELLATGYCSQFWARDNFHNRAFIRARWIWGISLFLDWQSGMGNCQMAMDQDRIRTPFIKLPKFGNWVIRNLFKSYLVWSSICWNDIYTLWQTLWFYSWVNQLFQWPFSSSQTVNVHQLLKNGHWNSWFTQLLVIVQLFIEGKSP